MMDHAARTGMTAESYDMPVDDREAAWPQGLTLVSQSVLPTMGALLLVPLVPMIAAEYQGRPNLDYWIGALLTVPALCIALFSIAAGALADRVGRRRLLICCLAIYGVAGAAPILLRGFDAMLVSRVVLGLCEAAVITISTTMLGDYFTGLRRDRWLALISTFASLSAIVFLGLSGAIGATFGWRVSTAIYALVLLIVPAMLLLTWEPRKHEANADPLSTIQFPWRHLAITGTATLFGSCLFYTLLINQGTALTELGIRDAGRIGLLTAVASIGNPIATLVFRRFTHVPSMTMLVVALALIGVGLAVVSLAGGPAGFVVGAFIGQGGCGFLLPTLITWTMRPLPFFYRARGTGVFQSLFALGQFVSTFVVTGIAHGIGGNVLGAMQVLGVVAIVAAIVLLGLCGARGIRAPAV